jgi:thiamine-phosphate pyrophosphorylase
VLDRRALSLCLVTDPDLVPAAALEETVLAAVRGGVTMVQLRDKWATDEALLAQAVALVRVLRPLGIPLLVNDRVEVARRAGADGVHVGQDDTSPEIARERLGPAAIIGLSITDATQLARAERAPVDYYGVGPYFATATKPDHQPPLGLDGGRALVARASRPCVAIGGIHPPRAAAVRATGVAGIAVVSAICGKPDPERAAHELLPAVTVAVSSAPEVLP